MAPRVLVALLLAGTASGCEKVGELLSKGEQETPATSAAEPAATGTAAAKTPTPTDSPSPAAPAEEQPAAPEKTPSAPEPAPGVQAAAPEAAPTPRAPLEKAPPAVRALSAESVLVPVAGSTTLTLELDPSATANGPVHIWWSASCGVAAPKPGDRSRANFLAPDRPGRCDVTAEVQDAEMDATTTRTVEILVTPAQSAGMEVGDVP